MTSTEFKQTILQGIPNYLPEAKPFDLLVNHAPKRKNILSEKEEKLALKNALRYFPVNMHTELAPEFLNELKQFGRIYM